LRFRKAAAPGQGAGGWAVDPLRGAAPARSLRVASSSCNKYNQVTGENKQPFRDSRSLVPRLEALNQFVHCWHVAFRIERVGCKAIGVVAGEHQLIFDIVGMADRLQRL